MKSKIKSKMEIETIGTRQAAKLVGKNPMLADSQPRELLSSDGSANDIVSIGTYRMYYCMC